MDQNEGRLRTDVSRVIRQKYIHFTINEGIVCINNVCAHVPIGSSRYDGGHGCPVLSVEDRQLEEEDLLSLGRHGGRDCRCLHSK